MGHFGALGAREVLGLKHGGRRGQARQGRQARAGEAGRQAGGKRKAPGG